MLAVALGLIGCLVPAAFRLSEGSVPRQFSFAVVLLVVGLLFLLRGSRIAWTIFLALTLLAIGVNFGLGQWWVGLAYLVFLGLLLAPESRRHVWRRPGEGSA
jgi:hypothetical protein